MKCELLTIPYGVRPPMSCCLDLHWEPRPSVSSRYSSFKAADVAWWSDAIWAEAEKLPCFPKAPEICVEVLSPSNTVGEIDQKRMLYFEAGAKEVWLCSEKGEITFFHSVEERSASSRLVPDFPQMIER